MRDGMTNLRQGRRRLRTALVKHHRMARIAVLLCTATIAPTVVHAASLFDGFPTLSRLFGEVENFFKDRVLPAICRSGECRSDGDCALGTKCEAAKQATGLCKGLGADKKCVGTPLSYVPGKATVSQNGLLLSQGLASRSIAVSGQPVIYGTGGGQSDDPFHTLPDGAAIFRDPNSANYKYVSNSEAEDGQGVVGAIAFDEKGRVIGYERLLSGTTRNCGGGATFWNTWISCEEWSGGQIWEVDPFGGTKSRKTVMGGPVGAAYEATAFDNRDPTRPTFYATIDSNSGPVLKFAPSAAAVQSALASKNYSQLLHTAAPNGTATTMYQYLVLQPTSVGTFNWTSSIADGRASASQYHQNCEGVDVRNGLLYITCKVNKELFILDLDAKTYTRSSTVSGAFDGEPDQLARLLDDSNDEDLLFFCEDVGSSAGVHGRDSNGKYYTMLQGEVGVTDGETTGVAFSPGNKFMYVSFQGAGIIFEIRRTDGRPFSGQRLDTKYHGDPNNANPFTTP